MQILLVCKEYKELNFQKTFDETDFFYCKRWNLIWMGLYCLHYFPIFEGYCLVSWCKFYSLFLLKLCSLCLYFYDYWYQNMYWYKKKSFIFQRPGRIDLEYWRVFIRHLMCDRYCMGNIKSRKGKKLVYFFFWVYSVASTWDFGTYHICTKAWLTYPAEPHRIGGNPKHFKQSTDADQNC